MTYFDRVKAQILKMPFVKYIPSWMNVFFTAVMVLLLELSLLTILITTCTLGIFEFLAPILLATAVMSAITKILLIFLFYIPMFIFKTASTILILLFPIFICVTAIKLMQNLFTK